MKGTHHRRVCCCVHSQGVRRNELLKMAMMSKPCTIYRGQVRTITTTPTFPNSRIAWNLTCWACAGVCGASLQRFIREGEVPSKVHFLTSGACTLLVQTESTATARQRKVRAKPSTKHSQNPYNTLRAVHGH